MKIDVDKAQSAIGKIKFTVRHSDPTVKEQIRVRIRFNGQAIAERLCADPPCHEMQVDLPFESGIVDLHAFTLTGSEVKTSITLGDSSPSSSAATF
jgi:hypothetical protein